MEELRLSEQELLRRRKRAILEEIGIQPYPAKTFLTNTTTAAIFSHYNKAQKNYQDVSLAGRIMGRRIIGAASFVELEDVSGRIQLYLHRDTLCQNEDKSLYNTVFKKLIDIGDIIGICGFVFTTKVGTIAIHVTEFTLLTKSLKPLPIVKEVATQEGVTVYDSFTDPEQRYRQRYVDLIVNPHVRNIFQNRTKILNAIRGNLDRHGYLEVETPILQPIYSGALARPFTTHHNTLDMPLYLRISNELYLKRLIVGGYEGVYEFSKDFRNEGMSRFHNPEFTLLELYVAYKDYHWMMEYVESLIEGIASTLYGTTSVRVGEYIIDFKKPWQRFTMYEAIQHFTGYDVSSMDEVMLRFMAQKLGVHLTDGMDRGKIIDEIFGVQCEPKLIQPTFILDYPVEMSPLAKRHRENPTLTERFEVICNGKEICNAYSELNDPIELQKRFESQMELGHRGDAEAMVIDHDFLRALSYGMPPTAGIGIGIDRLVMIMTNSASIQDVIFFPQMRTEKEY